MGEPSASGREAGFLNVSTATCVAAGMVIFDRDVRLLLTAAHPPIPAVSGCLATVELDHVSTAALFTHAAVVGAASVLLLTAGRRAKRSVTKTAEINAASFGMWIVMTMLQSGHFSTSAAAILRARWRGAPPLPSLPRSSKT